MLRKIRITLAIIFFTLINILLLDFTGALKTWLGWTAKIQFIPALLALNMAVVIALVVLTLIFGRLYCSVICPLGVFQDFIAWVHNKIKPQRYSYSKPKTILRSTLFGLMVVAFIAGVHSVVALLAPYSTYGRIANNLFEPVYKLINNGLAALAEHFESYAFYSTDIYIKSLPTFLIATAFFILIFVLAWRGGRTYCNTVCPVGSLLGFKSRYSLFKIKLDESKCITCGLCAKNCKASSINLKEHKIDYSRCVACGNCIGKCNKSALHYTLKMQSSKAKVHSQTPKDESKRVFLLSTALAATSVIKAQTDKKVDGGLANIQEKQKSTRKTPLTPPGSYSAAHFAKHCTACQLCVTVCPNDVLRPSTDLMTLMQPTMSYEKGYCRPECTRCSEVCPTEAIRPITKAEKSSIQIGHSVWIRKNCLPVTQGVNCGNCARHCPTGAIQMIQDPQNHNETPVMIPIINTELCIGCGECENLCPARPYSAIYVEGHEMHKTI